MEVEQQDQRVKRLDQQLAETSQQQPYGETVGWLRCMRGIDTVTAMASRRTTHRCYRRPASSRDDNVVVAAWVPWRVLHKLNRPDQGRHARAPGPIALCKTRRSKLRGRSTGRRAEAVAPKPHGANAGASIHLVGARLNLLTFGN